MTDSRQLTSMRGSCATCRAAFMRSIRSCGARSALSGLPGVTSHHTRSSFKRLIANRLMARCARCGGSNEPPRRPMRMPLAYGGRAEATDGEAGETLLNAFPAAGSLCASRPRLSVAVNAVFEAGQLFCAHRASGVKSAGGNADLGAEAELAAIGKLGGCIVQHDGRIDLIEEFVRGDLVLGHDRVGVVRSVVVNMGNRLVESIDDLGCDDRVLILGIPVFV